MRAGPDGPHRRHPELAKIHDFETRLRQAVEDLVKDKLGGGPS